MHHASVATANVGTGLLRITDQQVGLETSEVRRILALAYMMSG